MTTIAQVVTNLVSKPAPLIIIDTCTLLDLFRGSTEKNEPRIKLPELKAAKSLLQMSQEKHPASYIIIPELVKLEYNDNATEIVALFDNWLEFIDNNTTLIDNIAQFVEIPFPPSKPIRQLGLQTRLKQLADDLLDNAVVLDRDKGCIDRAFDRLLDKRRPSHKKEIKDSINVEQCLELCRQLQQLHYTFRRIFVSSNTKDFASSPQNRLHPDLAPDFTPCNLEYYSTLEAAVGTLGAKQQIP